MRKTTLLLSFVLLFGNLINAQMMGEFVALYQGAFTSSGTTTTGTVQTNTSASFVAQYGVGLGFNSALKEKMAFGINLQYLGGVQASANTNSTAGGTASASNSWIAIEPKFEFYPKEVYRGFYVGPKVAFNLGLGNQSQSQMNLGAKLGWMFPLSDAFRLGLDWSIGYSKSFEKKFNYTNTSGGTSEQVIAGGGGLFTGWNVRFGYIFGGK